MLPSIFLNLSFKSFLYLIKDIRFKKVKDLKVQNDDILKLIRSLNIQEAHGPHDISIHMIKICDSVLVKPLWLIFQNCLNCSTFPDVWKKSNILNRPALILPVFGEIFEKLISKSLFEYLDEQKLLSERQSGFRPNDSCTNQLLSIAHDLYTAFNADPTLDVRGGFLDMSKAFDKLWHEG